MVDPVELVRDRRFTVTGGAGFIGGHLVERLVALGAERVIVIDDGSFASSRGVVESLPRVDVREHALGRDPPAALDALLTGSSAVFHLAARKHNQSREDTRGTLETNIQGTFDLAEAAGRSGVGHLVYASTLYVYGRTQGEPFREDEPALPATVYGVSKLTGEHLVAVAGRAHGMTHTTLRLMFTYGPRQFRSATYQSVIARGLERIAAGLPPQIFGDGRQVMDFVYVDDVVDAFVQALDVTRSDGQTLNVGCGVGVSIRDLTRDVLATCKSSLEPQLRPADATANTTRVANVDRATHVLDWRPRTPLDVGLRLTRDALKR